MFNTGNTDQELTNYLMKKMADAGDDALEKAQRSSRLVARKQMATRKDGKQYMTTVWVNPDDIKKEKTAKMRFTDEMHKTESGKYTQERAKLHREIRDKVISQCGKPKEGERPVAILMGGGSASGKSTMKEGVLDPKLKSEGIQAGTVDSDKIKESLPEYAGYQKIDINEAARYVHNESSEIGAHIIDTAVEEGRNFVYDGTMKSTGKYEQLINRLKDAGYDVHIYVCDIPTELAIERSDARAKKSGRKVPHEIIKASHAGVPKSVEKLKDKVNSFQVFDNSGDELQLIASNDYVEPEKYTAFLAKGGVKYRATADS